MTSIFMDNQQGGQTKMEQTPTYTKTRYNILVKVPKDSTTGQRLLKFIQEDDLNPGYNTSSDIEDMDDHIELNFEGHYTCEFTDKDSDKDYILVNFMEV